MKKSAFISDVLFSFFISALFTLCFFRYLKIALWLTLLLALLCGALTALSVGAILRIKRKNFFLKKSDEAQKQKLLLHLALLSDHEKTEYFRSALSSSAPAQRVGQLRVSTPTEYFFLHFKLAPVTPDDVAVYSRLKTSKSKILLCSKIEEEANALCARLHIEVRTGERVYQFLKTENALPVKYLGEENGKRKRHFKLWFSKVNSKRFLVCGGFILLASFLAPFPLYYILFGSILLLAALFVRFFGYE